jgi:hypothetical protein
MIRKIREATGGIDESPKIKRVTVGLQDNSAVAMVPDNYFRAVL